MNNDGKKSQSESKEIRDFKSTLNVNAKEYVPLSASHIQTAANREFDPTEFHRQTSNWFSVYQSHVFSDVASNCAYQLWQSDPRCLWTGDGAFFGTIGDAATPVNAIRLDTQLTDYAHSSTLQELVPSATSRKIKHSTKQKNGVSKAVGKDTLRKCHRATQTDRRISGIQCDASTTNTVNDFEQFWTGDVRHVGIQLSEQDLTSQRQATYSDALKKSTAPVVVRPTKICATSSASKAPAQPTKQTHGKTSSIEEAFSLGAFIIKKKSTRKLGHVNTVKMNARNSNSKLQPSEASSKRKMKRIKGKVTNRGNYLDSSMPIFHKGKQRENPKKKLSSIKKLILKERCDYQRLINGIDNLNVCDKPSENAEEEASTSAESANKEEAAPSSKRNVRNNCLSKTLDDAVTAVIQQLGVFQDRLYAKDKEKARRKKRLIYGLREVLKFVKVEKIKCVIFVPDIESRPVEGALDRMVYEIVSLCEEQKVPYFFALTKRKLGYVSHKHAPVSCAGIMTFQGADEPYKHMLQIVEEEKAAYRLHNQEPSADKDTAVQSS